MGISLGYDGLYQIMGIWLIYDRIMIWDILDITSFCHELCLITVSHWDRLLFSVRVTARVWWSSNRGFSIHKFISYNLLQQDKTWWQIFLFRHGRRHELHLQTSGTIPPIPCHSLRHPQGVSVLMMRDVLRCVPEILGWRPSFQQEQQDWQDPMDPKQNHPCLGQPTWGRMLVLEPTRNQYIIPTSSHASQQDQGSSILPYPVSLSNGLSMVNSMVNSMMTYLHRGASQGGMFTLENPNMANQGVPAKIAKHRTIHLALLENWVPKCRKIACIGCIIVPIKTTGSQVSPVYTHIDTPRHGHKGQLRGHASHRQTRWDEFATQLQLGRQGDRATSATSKLGEKSLCSTERWELLPLNSPFLWSFQIFQMVGDVVNILKLEGPMRSIMEIVAPVSMGAFFKPAKQRSTGRLLRFRVTTWKTWSNTLGLQRVQTDDSGIFHP